jgi:predicted dehydrogenase
MVWKEMHGVPMDVSPSGSGSRENAFTASYRAEWAHFEAAIAGEAKVPSLEEHLTLHRVVDAIYRSAQDGRDVVL